MYRWSAWAVFYAGIGYSAGFYYVTDPAQYSLYKITIVYTIITVGFLSLYRSLVPIWFYGYIIFIYVVFVGAAEFIFRILRTSL